MCGIVGVVNYKEDISNQYYIIKKMTKAITKRGPDEEGIFVDKHCNLGHRRLSIVDIENGKQPMRFSVLGTDYVIVYNGQLYNTNELRDVLKKNGFVFKGHSDTEVLLKSFIHYGETVCKYLNGIFGFAIWNSRTEELFIARDQFGIKPLYYSKLNGHFIFASEIKSILAFPGVEPVLDTIRN